MKRAMQSESNGEFFPFFRPAPGLPLVVNPCIRYAATYVMHRFEKRMVPCLGEGCVFDKAGIPIEHRTMFPAWDAMQFVGIVDLPATLADTLKKIADCYGGLNRVKLRITRLKGISNGPVVASVASHTDEKLAIPKAWTDETLDRVLDRLLASNLQYAMSNLDAVKIAKGQISRLTRDLGAV